MNITSGQRTRTLDENKKERSKSGALLLKLSETPRTLAPAGVAVYELPIDKIRMHTHSRGECAPESIAALAQSIRKYGVIHPLTVRTDASGGDYELVSGARRLRAARLLGMRSIRCIVITRDRSYSDAVSLCENIHSDSLHFLDIAEGIGRLCSDYGYSISSAASKLCLSERYVADMVRLLSLSPTERDKVRSSGLSSELCQLILELDDVEMRKRLIDEIVSRRLDIVSAERLLYTYLKKKAKKERNRPATYLIRDIRIFYNTIDRALEVMRGAGYSIIAEKKEEGECTVITIKIPN